MLCNIVVGPWTETYNNTTYVKHAVGACNTWSNSAVHVQFQPTYWFRSSPPRSKFLLADISTKRSGRQAKRTPFCPPLLHSYVIDIIRWVSKQGMDHAIFTALRATSFWRGIWFNPAPLFPYKKLTSLIFFTTHLMWQHRSQSSWWHHVIERYHKLRNPSKPHDLITPHFHSHVATGRLPLTPPTQKLHWNGAEWASIHRMWHWKTLFPEV